MNNTKAYGNNKTAQEIFGQTLRQGRLTKISSHPTLTIINILPTKLIGGQVWLAID